MPWIPPSIHMLLAQAAPVTADVASTPAVEGPPAPVQAAAEVAVHVDYFPLQYQILCIILTALFIWIFSIARNPRGWRRLYQAKFCRPEDHSINRNKKLDEQIRSYGIVIAMIVLVADVGCVVWGVTNRYRSTHERPMTKEEQFRAAEAERIQGAANKTNARRAVGG